ncbi:MAG: phosphatidylserine decarboxylase family protein [Chloroflexi bacterium]|nr:phosphatidylserine decarboxylase family protein [Chloroflexota bacterium]
MGLAQIFKPLNVPVLRDGVVLALPLLAIGGALARRFGWPWGFPWLLASAAVLYFFRDPNREIPTDPDLVVAPADGRVAAVEQLPDGGEFETRLSIVLGLRNVHVIRSPVAGRVVGVTYTRGQFVDAERPDAHRLNEQNRIRLEDGPLAMELVQIAGLIARRIVCWVSVGEPVQRGQRIGLIRFGSRTDVYLGPGARVLVGEGARLLAGRDPIARLRPVD